MFLPPVRILFSWAIISCVSSSNVSTITATLFIVSSKSSPICSILSLVFTMSLSVCFSYTSSILLFTILLPASIILRIFSSSKSESQPFFLIALAWSHNHCSVISKTPCSFHSCIICCLYPLTGLPSSSKYLLLKKHSITILLTFLDHFVLTVLRWWLGLHCRTREHLPREEPSPTGPALFTPLFSEFWFYISLIRGLVNFRLHNHQYFYRDTISRWLPATAKERFIYP